MKVIVTPHARTDLDEITDYIANDRPSSAIRFINAAQATLALLSDNPEAGVKTELSNERLAGLRRFRVRGFKNYLIFYIVRQQNAVDTPGSSLRAGHRGNLRTE